MTGIESFIGVTFGTSFVEKLKHISQGGNNNFKGSEYESMLACIKICQFAADINSECLDQLYISVQEMAFVDDLTIVNKYDKKKINYQAKNSDGQAAKWTPELHDRFKKQKKIDTDYHEYANNKQILVVSSKDKHVENANILKDIGEPSFESEYVPYDESVISLIREFLSLREALGVLAIDTNMATLEYVYTMVLAAWAASAKARAQSVGDLIGVAKALGKPSFFKSDIQAREVPDWLKNLCGSVQDCAVELELGSVYVYILGLKLNLGVGPEVTSEAEQLLAKEDRNAFDVANVLMKLASEEYKQPQLSDL